MIKKNDHNKSESAVYFPAGIYDIYKQNDIFKTNVTLWKDVDNINEIYESIKKILENFNYIHSFEGIPALFPFYSNVHKSNVRKKTVCWGFIVNIKIELKINSQNNSIF